MHPNAGPSFDLQLPWQGAKAGLPYLAKLSYRHRLLSASSESENIDQLKKDLFRRGEI
jgi:hypothetical protein